MISTLAAQVLVVDDDEDLRETVCSVLEDEGHCVARARNGRDALEFLRREPAPRLVLLDQRMPVMDGATFLEVRRGDPALAGIPVVLFSADKRHARAAIPAGVELVLDKPIDIDKLLEVVRRYCSRAAQS